MANTARQVEFLLTGYRNPSTDEPLSGGKVVSYFDGTTTETNLWTDRNKSAYATNPIILDSFGRAEVYGDGIYKFEIYDSADTPVETINGLDISVSNALTDLDEDTGSVSGLTWGYQSGDIRFGNSIISVSAGTLTLTDDATNYVEVDSAGNVSANISGFTAGSVPIREIITASGVISTSTDKRAWVLALGTAATKNTGTASGEVPTNDDATGLQWPDTDTSTPYYIAITNGVPILIEA